MLFLLCSGVTKGAWHLYADTFERYCFSSQAEISKAKTSLENIKAPVDTISREDNCVVVTTSERRREIIQKYLLKLYPNVNIAFSSEDSIKEECNLRVEKETKSTEDNTRLKVKKTVNFGNTKITNSKKEISTIKVLSGKEFELSQNEETLFGKCRYQSQDRYEIEFSMLFIPRPVNPYDPSTFKQKEGESVSTTVSLTRGQKMNIASIKTKLQDEASKKALQPAFGFSKSAGGKTTTVYLMME